MDFMEKIVDLRSQKKKLADQAAKLVEEGKLEESGKLADQMEALNRDIQSVERLLDAARQNAQPLDGQGSMTACFTGRCLIIAARARKIALRRSALWASS